MPLANLGRTGFAAGGYVTGGKTITSVSNMPTLNTNAVSVSYTFTGMSSQTFSMVTGNVPMFAPKKSRGWNAKKQIRCCDCSRFAKEIIYGGATLLVDCGRCGKSAGYVGKRF